jgi:hypothetical protein
MALGQIIRNSRVQRCQLNRIAALSIEKVIFIFQKIYENRGTAQSVGARFIVPSFFTALLLYFIISFF